MSALPFSGNICSATFNAERLLPTRTSPETAARCSLKGPATSEEIHPP